MLRDVDTREAEGRWEGGKNNASGQVGLAAACAPFGGDSAKVTHGEGAGLRSCLFKEKRGRADPTKRSQHKITPTKGNGGGCASRKERDRLAKRAPSEFPRVQVVLTLKGNQ